MLYTFNHDAYEFSEEQKPILAIENNPSRVKLLEACEQIALVERQAYPLFFQLGQGAPDIFSYYLEDNPNHFVSLFQSDGKVAGYFIAWREKMKIKDIVDSFDDDFHINPQQQKDLLGIARKASIKGKIDFVSIADIALLPNFRRSNQTAYPPIIDLLTSFSAWLNPKTGETIFISVQDKNFLMP